MCKKKCLSTETFLVKHWTSLCLLNDEKEQKRPHLIYKNPADNDRAPLGRFIYSDDDLTHPLHDPQKRF